MFLIATSGRCGTMALCEGLNRFSDHAVEHEPEPRLLEEAHLKHRGLDYRTPTLEDRLRFFHRHRRRRYGQSFRAPNLLADVCAVVPGARVLVIVRPPLDYVLSAHFMRVFQRGDEWDRTRILPRDTALADASLAERLAWHWVAVNDYLLDFAESNPEHAGVAILAPLEERIETWSAFLGIRITDIDALTELLRSRPNAARTHAHPEGYEEQVLDSVCDETWGRAQKLATM